MVSIIYFISLIIITVLIPNFLDKLKFDEKLKIYLYGLAYGLISFSGMYLHYFYVEPSAIFPKINIYVGHSFLLALSFFLFGYKAGVITLLLVLPARIFLTQEFLSYSLLLYFLSSLNGYYFNKIYYRKNSKSLNLKIIVLFTLAQSFLSFVIFLLKPIESFSDNLRHILIFLFPILAFVNILISVGILRTRLLKKLWYDLKYEDGLLSNVIYNLSEAVIVLDKNLNVLRINNLAEKFLGYNLEDIQGKYYPEFCNFKNKEFVEEVIKQIKDLEVGKTIVFREINIITSQGEEKCVDYKITSFIEDFSKDKIFVVLIKDISDIIKNKKQIEESEKRFRQFFNFSLEGIWRYDVTEPIDINLSTDEQIKLFFERGFLADCNDIFAKMYGYQSKDDLIGIPLSVTLIPDDEKNIQYLRKFIENCYRLTNAESIEKDKEGNIKYFINSLYGIIDENYITGAWGIQIDVTEDKLTTKQIRDNNRLLLSILNAPKGIIIFSLDKNYCYTAFSISHKETMKKIWGVDIELGMNMLDAIKLEADRIKAKNNFDRALSGEYLNLVEEYSDISLLKKFYLNNYSPIFDGSEIIGLAVYVTDITQQKLFESELESKNLLLDTLINSLPDSVYVKDKNLRKILTNKTDLKWMGFDDENQALGKRDDEIYGEEFARLSLEDDKKVIAGIPVINREEKIITKNNDEIIILSNKVPLYNKDGEIIGLVGIGRDITETKKYLIELEKNQQKLDILFNQTFQFIGLLTPSGILLEANQTACDFIGVDVNEVRNLPFPETPWWTHSKAEQDKLYQAIKSASEGKFIRMETTHLNKEKEERIIDFSLMPIKNNTGKVVYLIAEGRDITDMKILQKRLSESEEKYRILIEAAMDGISIINSDAVILFENEKHKDLFISISDENKKRNYFNLIVKDDVERFKAEFKMVQSLKSNFYITLRFLKNDKEFFWGELSIKKFLDSEGQILFICVLRDITFKKQIEDELKKRVFELEKYNQLMVGREIKMVELKKEVNALCKQFGLPVRYSDDDI